MPIEHNFSKNLKLANSPGSTNKRVCCACFDCIFLPELFFVFCFVPTEFVCLMADGFPRLRSVCPPAHYGL